MTKVKELKFPDECVNCKINACSDCGHNKARAKAIDKYYKQFERTANINTRNQMVNKINNEIKNMKDKDVILLLTNIRFNICQEIRELTGFCKFCKKPINADIIKYPKEFDKNLCPDCNIEYAV